MNTRRTSAIASQPRPSRRAAFTLLEMLLAAILSTILMFGLWSLFGTYMRLFETGEAKAERSQLIRALGEQLAGDLSASVAPPGATRAGRADRPDAASLNSSSAASIGAPASSADASPPADLIPPPLGNAAESALGDRQASLPAMGLIGTSRSLRLDVLQTVSDPASLPRAPRTESSGRQTAAPVAPELRSVLYTFEEPHEVRPADHRPPPGLVRRERDWQSLWEQSASAARTDPGTGGDSAEAEIARSIAAFGLNAPEAFEEQVDEATTWIPEVVGLEFRYFDGREWQEEWNSRARRALPAAVEMALWIRDATRPRDGTDGPAAREAPDERAGAAAARGSSRADRPAEPATLAYRDVIVLRQSPLAQPSTRIGGEPRPARTGGPREFGRRGARFDGLAGGATP